MGAISRRWGQAMDSIVLAALWLYRTTLGRAASADLKAKLEKDTATLRNVRRYR